MENESRAILKLSKSREGFGRWEWLPITVFVVGILSMAMLLWTDQISRSQRTQFSLVYELMDLRIRVATSYLWLEEWLEKKDDGQPEVVPKRVSSDLDEAIRVSERLLNGGKGDHGQIVEALKSPELRKQAEDIRRYLAEFATISRQRVQRSDVGGVGSVLEDRHEMVFTELQRGVEDLEFIVTQNHAADYAKSRRLLTGIFLGWSTIVGAATMALVSRERRRKQAEVALQRAKDDLETRVTDRTRELKNLNEQLRAELGERKRTEEALRKSERQLRHLSDRLLAAQEMERRRIATELHDELGHSLILMKLRLGLIEKDGGESHPGVKEGCQYLSLFIDQVIEEVRRLARDLRPSALEDLGLSAALRWLVNNFVENHHTSVEASIIDSDHLVSGKAQIILYRIIQEALTNVGKHAQATRVSLVVKRLEDQLSVVVEDDGRGFDVTEALTREAAERGFGLAAMDERAQMMGGSLRVWSEVGKGTRITLGVPVSNGSARG